jgi:hypothetical protein
MLTYVLAIAIGLISIIFFLAAFFAPKVHRQDDFLWSGVGLFYALVLWVCAERITGAILLGQTAATLLLLAYGAETINLRGAIANPDKIPAMKSFSVSSWLLSSLGGLFSFFRKPQVKLENTTAKETISEANRETQIEPKISETSNLETEVEAQTAESSTNKDEALEETIAEELEAVTEELKQTTSASSSPLKTAKKGNVFSGLLGKINNSFGKNKTPQTVLTASPILEVDEDVEEKIAESLSDEVEESTSTSIAKTASEESKTISEVVPEVSQEIVEKVETTVTSSDNRTVMETKIEVEATETVVIENQNFQPEQTITEELSETVSPQNTPPVKESDAPNSESNSTEEAIDTPATPTNDLQKQSDVNEEKEKPTNSSSDFKAEIAKIFEEDENNK